MIALPCTEQSRLFDSSEFTIQAQPLHQNIEELEKPTIDMDDEESSNPVLKGVVCDVRRTQMQFGVHHPKYAEAWNALGLIRIHMQGNAEAARRCHEYALTIFREKKMAKETATSLNDLGYCCERLDLPEKALNHYREALEILEGEDISETDRLVLSTRRSVDRMMRK